MRTAAAALSLLLAGCGPRLGDYEVTAVRVTARAPLPADTVAAYRRFLDVRLRSRTDLTAPRIDAAAIYVDADFCPLRDRDGLIAFGPFDDGGGQPTRSSVRREPDANGSYFYRVYVPVAHRSASEPLSGPTRLPTYDLRRTDRAICLRLKAPGYHVTRSRSDAIVVSAAAIRDALGRLSIVRDR